MIIALILLSIICFAMAIGLYFSLRLNLKQSEKLQQINNKIEESLDVLDVCYQRATTRANLEVFSDEPVVRELVEDIRLSKDVILLVANLLVEESNKDNEEDELND
jgi:hypothetical protein